MEQKKIIVQDILDEIERALRLYNDDITHCGFEIQLALKNTGVVNIKKNINTTPYYGYCGPIV